MKAGIGEAFAFVFTKESTVAENYVVNFISGAFAIQPVPL